MTENWRNVAKVKQISQTDIAKWFFLWNAATEGCYQCKSCPTICKAANLKVSGCGNLFSHLEYQHPPYAKIIMKALESGNYMNIDLSSMNSTQMNEAIQDATWIDWVVTQNLPFSLVDSPLTRTIDEKFGITNSHKMISQMETISEKVVKKITSHLPVKFGLVFDSWSEAGTHFVALFAAYHNKTDPSADARGNCYVLLSMAALLDETSYSAEDHVAYIEAMLQMYGREKNDVAFLVGDNCPTNPAIANLLQVPIIGCFSHKLNLAMKLIFDSKESLITKVKAVMSELGTLKNRSLLRTLEALSPVKWNETRWTSTFDMLKRYEHLHPILSFDRQIPIPEDLKSKLLSAAEFTELIAFLEDLEFPESATYELQKDSCNIEHARIVMDHMIRNFSHIEGVTDYLCSDGTLVNNPDFEIAAIKALKNEYLSRADKARLKSFESPEFSTATKPLTAAEQVLHQESASLQDETGNIIKKRKYELVYAIPATSAMVERLFSHAKTIFEPRRRQMTPFHLEMLLFLKLNRNLWDWESLLP